MLECWIVESEKDLLPIVRQIRDLTAARQGRCCGGELVIPVPRPASRRLVAAGWPPTLCACQLHGAPDHTSGGGGQKALHRGICPSASFIHHLEEVGLGRLVHHQRLVVLRWAACIAYRSTALCLANRSTQFDLGELPILQQPTPLQPHTATAARSNVPVRETVLARLPYHHLGVFPVRRA